MATLTEIFKRINENKKKQKDIKDAYREVLLQSEEHKELTEQLKTIREKKKKVEQVYQAQFQSEFTQLEDYKIDLASDLELLSDAALTQLMKGETIEITDEDNVKYEPIFNVKFKKTA